MAGFSSITGQGPALSSSTTASGVQFKSEISYKFKEYTSSIVEIDELVGIEEKSITPEAEKAFYRKAFRTKSF